MDTSIQILAVTRDILVIIVMLVAVVLVFRIWQITSEILNSTRSLMKNAEEMVDTVCNSIVGPAKAGSGVIFEIGKLASYIIGITKKGSKGGKDHGK